MRTGSGRAWPQRGAGSPETADGDLAALLGRVAKGDLAAFDAVYDCVAASVFGVVRGVVRDGSLAEEVTQEVVVEVWRTASRFDRAKGSAMAWVATIAHRRAIDRVRSEQKAAERELRAATAAIAYDDVVDTVEAPSARRRSRSSARSLPAWLPPAAAAPPEALKDRAITAAARVRQLPPATGEVAAARISRRRPGWLALAAVCAFGVLAGIFGLTARSEQHQLSQDQQRNRQVAAVLTARDAVMVDGRVRTGGTAAVVMSSKERALVFAANGLRALASSKGYELWLIGPGGDTPAGMLPTPRQGRTGPVIARGLASGDRLGLTIEPAGGSKQPTSPMILELAL